MRLRAVSIVIFLLTVFIYGPSSHAANVQTGKKPPEIVYFFGNIEIVYPDSPSITLHTGDKPPMIEAGTVIRVIDGSLSLNVNDDVQSYKTGDAVRITETNGNWVAAAAWPSTSPASTNTNLSNPSDDQSESEIIQEEETEETPAEEEEEEETEVSPS